MMPISAARLRALLIILVLCSCGDAWAQSSDIQIDSSSGGNHAWLLVPAPKTQGGPAFELRHLADRMDPVAYSRHHGFADRPAAIAAMDDEVFVVMSPTGEGDARRREVYSARIVFNEPVAAWYVRPHDRMSVEASLPGNDRLVGVVGTRDGLIALLIPRQSRQTDTATNEARLLVRRGLSWEPEPLPESFVPGADVRIVSSGVQREQLWILNQRDRGARTEVFRRDADGTWSQSLIGLDLRNVHSCVAVGSQLAVIQEVGGELHVQYLRSTRLIELGAVPQPQQPWVMIGLGDRMLLLTRAASIEDGGEVVRWSAATVDPVDGTLGEALELEISRGDQIRIWLSSIVLGFLLLGVVAVIASRPPTPETLHPPDGQVAMPLASRLLALGIDLIPPAVLTMLVFGCDLADLARSPFFVTEPAVVMPNMVLCLGTSLHSELSTALTGRSLGKWLLGGRVISSDGGRPGARDAFLRGFGKTVTLMVPLVGVIAALTRYNRALADFMGRSFVVMSRSVPQAPDSPGD